MAQPLLKAIQKDDADKIAKLSQKVDINARVQGSTFLIKALTSEECAFAVLEIDGCDVNLCDDEHRSPLTHAVLCQSPALVQALLDRGATVSAQPDGTTPAHWAAEHNELKCLQLLGKSRPACLSEARQDAETPLSLACRGATEAALFLLDKGCLPQCDPRELVERCLRAKLFQVLLRLVELSESDLAPTPGEDSCLHLAVKLGAPPVVVQKLLQKTGLALAGPSAPVDAFGRTPEALQQALQQEQEQEQQRRQQEQQQSREAKKEKQRLEYAASVEASEVTAWLAERGLGHLAEPLYAKGVTRLSQVAQVQAAKVCPEADTAAFVAAQEALNAALPEKPAAKVPVVSSKGYATTGKVDSSKMAKLGKKNPQGDYSLGKVARGSASSTSKGAATNYIKP